MVVGKAWVRHGYISLIYTCLMVAACVQTGGITVQVLTNQGRLLQGRLTGIHPVFQLDPTELTTNISLTREYEIPLATVQQITVDFPRIIIETEEKTYIGPFSAFHGIPERLVIQQGEKSAELYTAALRTIAVAGTPIHPAPRKWLNNDFLSVPKLPIPQVTKEAPCEVTKEVRKPEFPPEWGVSYPAAPPMPPEEPSLWQTRLLIAGFIFMLYFML